MKQITIHVQSSTCIYALTQRRKMGFNSLNITNKDIFIIIINMYYNINGPS